MFSNNDHTRIADAIRTAEQQTSGELVVIVSGQPYRYPTTALTVAALAALTLPFTAVVFGWSPADILPDWDALDPRSHERRSLEVLVCVQALIFAATLALGWFTPLARKLTPEGLRRDRVHRTALTQFRARGLDATHGRTGVLLYVDEPDHIAEVIADTAVFNKVPAEHWADTIDALTAGFRAGQPADGLIAAIALAGSVLAAHFPPDTEADRNDLPDHLIEI
jgi:putative membrane protein